MYCNHHRATSQSIILFLECLHTTMASQLASTAIVEEVLTVDVQKAKDLITSGHGYLDVRTEEEYKKGHVDVEKIHNIPYMFSTPEGRVKNPEFLEQVLSVCKTDDPLVVGCQTGVRSLYATTDLQKSDFKTVCNMGGGYVAWVKIGFEVTKPEEEEKLVVVSDNKAEKLEKKPVGEQITEKEEAEIVSKEKKGKEEAAASNDKTKQEDKVLNNVAKEGVEISNGETVEEVA